MGEKELTTYECEESDNEKEGRYYLGNGLWSHPETGGNFYFSDERKNH